MITKIQKWGNSLAVRIPKVFAEEAQATLGSEVNMRLKDGELIITPLQRKERLGALLARISKDNLHRETDTGDARGNEVW